ncbi:MAG: type II secretion system GspH family protein [Sedimentisphaerales bacterium]|nr:type II secretion system GspH family protein [Sedimentisphaerales bacterium]
MKKSFTLVEILIVVAILGILAAMTLPILQGHITEAKESAAKDDLRILRNTIGLYAARHGGIPPGYPNDDLSQNPSKTWLPLQLLGGKYLNQIPENPFNGYGYPRIKMVGNNDPFPDTPAGNFAWMYKPATKEIRLDWPGTDKNGGRYYDY